MQSYQRLSSALSVMQALASQETDRANTADTEVARLEQEVQSSEGSGWYRELQQAQQDLLVAQVLFTHLAIVPISSFGFVDHISP